MPKYKPEFKRRYLLSWPFYRNWFWYGWDTAIYLENLVESFDDLINTLEGINKDA